jgi:hypothetical protein
MSRLWAKIIGLGLLAGLLLPGIAAAAGDEESFLVLVADTRKLTGWESWWANLYNESHLYFTLITIVIIPVVGLCFGLLADIVMSRIGLDLKSRELAEH